HAHRPELAAVHRGLDAAGERVLAGEAEILGVARGLLRGGHDVRDLDAAPGGEARLALGDPLLRRGDRALPPGGDLAAEPAEAPRVEPEVLPAGGRHRQVAGLAVRVGGGLSFVVQHGRSARMVAPNPRGSPRLGAGAGCGWLLLVVASYCNQPRGT